LTKTIATAIKRAARPLATRQILARPDRSLNDGDAGVETEFVTGLSQRQSPIRQRVLQPDGMRLEPPSPYGTLLEVESSRLARFSPQQV